MYLKEIKHNTFGIIFGSSDKSNRMRSDLEEDFSLQSSGIKHGISSGQWENHLELENEEASEEDDEKYKQVGSSSSIGRDEVEFIGISYNKDSFIRYMPTLSLKDFDEAMFLPILNKSLAEKVKAIHIYSDGYKIQKLTSDDFTIDSSEFDSRIPAQFSDEELADPWVRIRPSSLSSAFHIRFFEQTPKRMYIPEQIENSLETCRGDA